MKNKFQACFLGYAIGDALASPVEDTYRSASDGEEPITFYTKAAHSHPLSHLEPGQYSDETQIMLIVAKSLLECGAFDGDDLSRKFAQWYENQKKRLEWRFPGNTMMNVCRKLVNGISWEKTGVASAGTIAVDRTLPYALVYNNSARKLREAIKKSCCITHTDPRVVAVSEAFAGLIGMGLEGQTADPQSVIDCALKSVQTEEPELIKKLKYVKNSLNMEPRNAVEALGNTGYCIDVFACALYWFLKAKGSFDATIVCAANSGGDNDSIAAIAGALYGAFYGLEAIPVKWLGPLEDCAYIKQLASNLYDKFFPVS